VRRYFGRRGSWDCREGSTGRATAEDLHGPSRGQRETLARRADLVRRQGQDLRDARRPSPRRRASLGVASPALRRTGGLDQLRSRALLPASLRRRERMGRRGARYGTRLACSRGPRDAYLSVATTKLRNLALAAAG